MTSLKDAREQVALDASTAYIELDTVNQELAAARQQESYAARLVDIEQQRAEAGVDPLSELLQAKLTAANVKLARIHLEVARRQAGEAAFRADRTAAGIDHSRSCQHPGDSPGPRRRTATNTARRDRGAAGGAVKAEHGQRRRRRSTILPQLSFRRAVQPQHHLLNNVNSFFAQPLPANNFSSGIAITVPLFDLGHRAKAHESAADALRATVEAEQAQRQNELQIAELTDSLKELDAQAEVANLKQQIAGEQLKTVSRNWRSATARGPAPGAAAAAFAQGRSNWRASTSGRNTKTRWMRGSIWPRRGWACCAPWATCRTGSTSCTSSNQAP